MLIFLNTKRYLLLLLLAISIPSMAQPADWSRGGTQQVAGPNIRTIASEVVRVDWSDHGFYVLLQADIYLHVPRKAKVLDAQAKPLSLYSLEEGDRVAVSYDVKGQPKTALRIQRLPKGGRP